MQPTGARGTDLPPLPTLFNFLFAYLFPIKFLYFFKISSLFFLNLTCSCPYSYNLMLTTYMCRHYINIFFRVSKYSGKILSEKVTVMFWRYLLRANRVWIYLDRYQVLKVFDMLIRLLAGHAFVKWISSGYFILAADLVQSKLQFWFILNEL